MTYQKESPRGVDEGGGQCLANEAISNYNPNAEQKPAVYFTLLTSHKPQTLTKKYFLNKDGSLGKSTAASMTEGKAETIPAKSMADFAEVLVDLKPNQALLFGTPKQSRIKLLTKKRFEERGRPEGYATRSKDHFAWPAGGGVLLLDYDPCPARPALSSEQLREQLTNIVPELANAGCVQWLSSSSLIFNGKTELQGVRGQRLYISVQDASDIPRAGQALVDRLWLAGHGYYAVSRSGQMLERCTVDSSVWQTNHLDFAAGACTTPPIEQRRGAPIVYEGDALNTHEAIPDLSEDEQAKLAKIKIDAKALVADESAAARCQFIFEMGELIAAKSDARDADQAASEVARRAVENHILMGDYPITLDDGTTITVGEALDDPASYHRRLTRDPIEPEYCDHKTVGKLFLIGSRPTLHSFAHGGQTFKLMRQPQRIEMVRGKTYEAVMQTMGIMRDMPDVFDLGGQLVTVDNGRALAMDEPLLAHYLGGRLQYYHVTVDRNVPREVLDDPSCKLTKTILSFGSSRNLKPLDAVITAPTMTPDGHIINKPGYHAGSRLLLDVSEPLPAIPEAVEAEHVRKAVDVLMHPYSDFPFCSELDKAVFLASLLTAVLRPALQTAPGFAFDAPVQGSGKTLLAQSVCALSTGHRPTVWPHTAGRDDEEIRKRIFTALRTGERVLLWDNVTGIFNSASVAALLTGASFTDRQLGKSEAITIPNRSLFLMTGNNLAFAGDMPRRMMICRVDPETDKPYSRQFDIDPLQYTLSHRQEMVAAALTIIRGWFKSIDFMGVARAPGRMASFEPWDDMVRQPIAWINREVMPGSFADIMDAVDKAQGADPEQESLGELLRELHSAFEGRTFTAKDVIHKSDAGFLSRDGDGLREAINDLAGGEVRSSKSLGRILQFREGRIVDGLVLRLLKNDKHGHAKKYKVVISA